MMNLPPLPPGVEEFFGYLLEEGGGIQRHITPCPAASEQRIFTGSNDGAVGRRLLALNTPLQTVPTRLNGGKKTSVNCREAALETSEAGHNDGCGGAADGFGGMVGDRRALDDGCSIFMHQQCGCSDERNVPAACVE